MTTKLEQLEARITRCRKCPRLVAHREDSAANPPKRFRGQAYWARPLPGFGDPKARLLIVGLAPAKDGGNRTGRFFTGDNSGVWLFRALHETGFANQPDSVSVDDGLKLTDAFISAVVRCAPPANKPTPFEIATCVPYLESELALMPQVKVVVALGQIAWKGFLNARQLMGHAPPKPMPKFGHGAEAKLEGGLTLLGSYHPSQQNTFTGKLTREMLRGVFERARILAQGG